MTQDQMTSLLRQGKTSVVRDKKAVASSSHPMVTQVILDVMREGGNAADAAIAGSLFQAVVEPHMTNHAGSVNFLFWDAKEERAYQLNSLGTLVSGLPRFLPMPEHIDPRCACIPGFMPGLGAIYERFASRPWPELCQPAIEIAREGYTMYSFQYALLDSTWKQRSYFPSSRQMFTPEGFWPNVGDRVTNEPLAQTLEALAAEGPQYFTTGRWGRRFVERGNQLGWPIKIEDMTAIPPRWQEPFIYDHRGHQVIQSSPPEQTGIYSRYVLGVLRELGIETLGHYTESAESLYLVAHTLRWVGNELGLLHDPKLFEVPTKQWGSDAYHRIVAQILKGSQPRVDLTEHVELTAGERALLAAEIPTSERGSGPGANSCELSIVDPQDNWVQMLHTGQSGGIPGVVVDGVPMNGSNAWAHLRDLRAGIIGWTTGGGRIKSVTGNTLVLRDGKPWLGLGSPGWCKVGTALMLHNILDFDMDPYQASVLPRMFPLDDDYTLEIENRLPETVLAGMAQSGIQIKPLNTFFWEMGSFQISWRDRDTGRLSSSADPRRIGTADGF